MEFFYRFFQKYKVEATLLAGSVLVVIFSFVLFLSQGKPEEVNQIQIEQEELPKQEKEKIFVDISGSVKKPGVYGLSAGSRLKEAVERAGGLSDKADKDFFAQNFNLARIVSDQEKIYVPSVLEIKNGIFKEAKNASVPQTAADPSKININTATESELDTLPGVGEVTAEKIIDGRPYQSIEELLTKKIVKKNVYEGIRNLITAD